MKSENENKPQPFKVSDVIHLAWSASAITSLLWEQMTNSHHPMLPVGYGAAWIIIMVFQIRAAAMPNGKS
jgi:hypothetical protein